MRTRGRCAVQKVFLLFLLLIKTLNKWDRVDTNRLISLAHTALVCED